MEDVIKIIAIGLLAVILIIIIKQYKQEYALYISIIAGVIILYMMMNRLEGIIDLLKSITNKAGVSSEFLGILLKITGIAFLAEFAISICKDAGESAIANKVEIGSKVVIISMSIPIISNLLDVIVRLL